MAIALASLASVLVAMALLYAYTRDSRHDVHFIYAGPAQADVASVSAEAKDRQASLRVCADPNNMPFSNERGEGFENALAEILARDLDRELRYAWWPQRRGFVRNTLRAGVCDLIIGVPARFELADTTHPYYRSSYVFVTRAEDALKLSSLDDPVLRERRIGLHIIGDDYSNVPPAQALAMRGIIDNVRGYSIYGDYSKPDPPRDLIDALVSGDIDVAIAWGPLAGYFSTRASVPLEITPIAQASSESIPMVFDIAMGVRHEDAALKAQVEQVLSHRKAEIDRVLQRFGVPLAPSAARADQITTAAK